MDVILFGPPACGKGTQAQFLSEQGYFQLSTGNIFRDHIARKTKLGRDIQQLMADGQLVPDYVTTAIVEEEVAHHKRPIVFDGFPRTQVQAYFLDGLLTRLKRDLGPVFNLVVPEPVLIERMMGRAASAHRPEDNEEAFALRLSDYHRKTEPLLKHYASRVIDLNGELSPEDISAQIRTVLGQQQVGDQAA